MIQFIFLQKKNTRIKKNLTIPKGPLNLTAGCLVFLHHVVWYLDVKNRKNYRCTQSSFGLHRVRTFSEMIEEELEPFSWCEDVRTVNASGVTFFSPSTTALASTKSPGQSDAKNKDINRVKSNLQPSTLVKVCISTSNFKTG